MGLGKEIEIFWKILEYVFPLAIACHNLGAPTILDPLIGIDVALAG